jgi:anthranilate synthase component 2
MLLMIDNYDSFTFNLVQYFGELGEEVKVVRNDEITLEGIAGCAPTAWCSRPAPARRPRPASACRPSGTSSASCPSWACAWATRASGRPWAAIVRAAPDARQDQRHHHRPRGVYAELPEKFTVIRYHSLVIERASLPAELEITATSEDGEIMGVRHTELAATDAPMEGVQFHPESILSEHGHAMLRNFLAMGRVKEAA